MSTGKPAISGHSLPGLLASAREYPVVLLSRADRLSARKRPCAVAGLDADGRRRRTRTAAA
jgi:hypothetical protein